MLIDCILHYTSGGLRYRWIFFGRVGGHQSRTLIVQFSFGGQRGFSKCAENESFTLTTVRYHGIHRDRKIFPRYCYRRAYVLPNAGVR